MTDLARKQMQTYMNNNPREKRPAHNYTLEQFGFTEAGGQKSVSKSIAGVISIRTRDRLPF